MPAALPAVGVGVLVVNLLAAGGIGFPGVAGTLWLLMALGLNGVERQGIPKISRHFAVAALLTLLVVGATCYWTAYLPVFQVRTAVRKADSARDPRQREDLMVQAGKADPLSAEPWKMASSLAFQRWLATGGLDDEAFNDFQSREQEALRLAPKSASFRHHCGQLYLTAYRVTQERPHLTRAVHRLQAAVDLYPNNCRYRVDLAEALREAGDTENVRIHATKAVEVDRDTPHEDQKLEGRRYLTVFRLTRKDEHLTEAVRRLEEAVQRYPANCQYRADLAVALWALWETKGTEGTRQQAAEAAEEAIRLDSTARSQNNKLDDKQRNGLKRIASGAE